MKNPFETGHIKNYILLYISIVVIMVLFFIASTLFNDIEQKEQKIFVKKDLSIIDKTVQKKGDFASDGKKDAKFKLLEKAY